MDLFVCRVTHKYWHTITTLSPDPYAVSEYTHTVLNSLQITLIIVNTKVKQYALPADDTASPYMVVTK